MTLTARPTNIKTEATTTPHQETGMDWRPVEERGEREKEGEGEERERRE
jgi:hypothetical protein